MPDKNPEQFIRRQLIMDELVARTAERRKATQAEFNEARDSLRRPGERATQAAAPTNPTGQPGTSS